MILEFAVREVAKTSGKTIGKMIVRQVLTNAAASGINAIVRNIMVTSGKQTKKYYR